MKHITIDHNNATYIGMDCHPTEHTAIAVNRFEEEKGRLTFANSWEGIRIFLTWIPTLEKDPQQVVIGLEGRGGKGSGFLGSILAVYEHVYEVNPQYTKQRRQFGTRGGKSDIRDAKCIAEIVIRKISELPKITKGQIATRLLLLKKLVWYYEQETKCATRLRLHLRQLTAELAMSSDKAEQKLIAQIIREKQKELEKLCLKQKSLEEKCHVLLAGHEENHLNPRHCNSTGSKDQRSL
ncbi:MAG: transposase [Acidobacteria bacterium]|nr:transposase [Acidobacteriota bacterium]